MSESEQNNNNEETDKSYILNIDNFNGPLDLLWDLIKKAKINITEISISQITEQYINYLKMLENLNVKIASEFIRMASDLLYYKSKALLPTGDIEDEHFVPALPPELIQKLLEYKKFQQSSKDLLEKFDQQSNVFSRENNLENIIEQEDYIDVTLFDLLRAFTEVIESNIEIEQEEIVFDEILVSDRIDFIQICLRITRLFYSLTSLV